MLMYQPATVDNHHTLNKSKLELLHTEGQYHTSQKSLQTVDQRPLLNQLTNHHMDQQ